MKPTSAPCFMPKSVSSNTSADHSTTYVLYGRVNLTVTPTEKIGYGITVATEQMLFNFLYSPAE